MANGTPNPLIMSDQQNPTTSTSRSAKIIAITSGKGGVGKTSLAVNLACELSQRGHRTIVVDTDLGLANAHILAGIKPRKTLSDYVEGRSELAEIIEDGPCKVKFISGGNGVREMANLDDNGRARICVAIEELQPFCDVILLDTGAGVSAGVTDFVTLAEQTILVTTSNFASIADAYGIVKVVVQDGYDRPIHCVVNRVRSPEEAEQVFLKIKGCTERFLGFDLNWLGLLPEDSSVEGAVLKRSPFSEIFPGSVAARYLAKLVTSLERCIGAPKSALQAARTGTGAG